jgi:hypothetical protein
MDDALEEAEFLCRGYLEITSALLLTRFRRQRSDRRLARMASRRILALRTKSRTKYSGSFNYTGPRAITNPGKSAKVEHMEVIKLDAMSGGSRLVPIGAARAVR